jgi:hypothetical protein
MGKDDLCVRRHPSLALKDREGFALLLDEDLGDHVRRELAGVLGDDIDRAGGGVRVEAEAGDVDVVDGLEPHGLPDAAGRGVPDAVGVEPLLASPLATGVGGIVGDDDDLVRAILECVGDVEGEGGVAAGVGADFLAVDADGAAPVDGAEVQDDAAALPGGGDFEGAAVVDGLIGLEDLADAGEGRFGREGDEDLALGLVRGGGILAQDRVVPEPVKVQPLGAFERWAGVLGPDVLRRDLCAPLGHEFAGDGGPSGRLFGDLAGEGRGSSERGARDCGGKGVCGGLHVRALRGVVKTSLAAAPTQACSASGTLRP